MPCPPQLQSTVHDMEQLLDKMTDPVKNLDQHLLYTENIRRIKDMLLELYTNPMYIEVRCKNDIDTKEIENSITNIKRRTSETHTDLRTWKATNTKTCRQEEAISVFTHIESSHNALYEEIMQHFDYLTEEDPVTTEESGMKETWKAKALSNLKELSNLRALVTIYDIACEDINMNMLGGRLNILHDIMLPQIQTVENEIRKQHLRNKLRDKISLIDTFLGSMTPPALTLI